MSDISDLTGKVKVGEWLSGMYNKSIADQKSELKALFTQIQDSKLTDEQRKSLQESKSSLQTTVEKLEAELAVLEEKMTQSQEEIDKITEQVATLLSTIKTQTETIEIDQKKHAQEVVEEVFSKRRNNDNYGVDDMVKDMYDGMRKFESNSEYKNLESNLTLLSGKESKIKSLVESAAGLIDSKNSLEKRYGVTKSTYDLISDNLSAASLTDASFTNADLGADKPVFSATKLETLVPYFDNTSINVEAGANSNYVQGSTAPIPTLDSINTKYKSYLKTGATDGVDSYSYSNATVQSLGKAIDAGLLEDLKMAGISGDKLVNFLTTNFAGANIVSSNGTLNIPYGHGNEASTIYAKLTNFVNNQTIGDDSSQWSSDYFKGVKNTWDINKGNTISSNNQIKSLSENFETIASSMVADGFTFKEAMYAMFNQDNGLFKDSGIIYDLNKQTKEPTYYMEYAGDDATAAAYKNVASIIYKNWGVKPTMCIDYDNIDKEGKHEDSKIDVDNKDDTQPKRTDPLTFVDGDTEYAFIVDRDKDGRFDGKNEFLGGDGSKTWLDDLKSLDADGNGVVEGDELKELKILKSKIKDNDKVTGSGNAKSETTSIGYEYTNAKDLGIESINLNNLEDKVNQKTGRTDVNNSEVFSDSFSFTLNGKEVTAKRKDDTDDYMNTVYGNTFGTRFDNKFGLTEDEIDNVIKNDYDEFDKVADKFKDYETKVNELNAFSATVDETNDFVDRTKAESDNEQKAIISRGQNKAQARYGNAGDWESIKARVKDAAREKGIDPESSDFLLQAQGMYTNDGSLSPEQIVNRYIDTLNAATSGQTRRENTKMAFDAMIACAKLGITVKIDEVTKLINDGEVSTVEEIVEHYQNKEAEG